MRILIATGIYPPDVGGPATYSKLLVDELPKHGFDVSVVSFGDFKHLPKVFSHFACFLKIMKCGKHTDIIYAQDPVSVGLPSALAARFLKKRFMLRLGGDYAWEQGVQRYGVTDLPISFSRKSSGYPIVIQILKKIQTWVASKAEKIIVPSEYLKKVILNWGVDKGKIHVIYSVVRKPGPQGRKDALRKLLRFEGTLIVSVGRLVPWKGFTTLIEIIPQLLKKIPSLKLLIIGSGPDEKKIENLIGKLNLHDHVIMAGSLEQKVLLRYLRVSDVFVLNTGYEGLSHQLLEAMSVGVPIVTTRVGGNPEIIQDGKEGILVKYNNKKELVDAILKVLRGKAFSERLVRNAKDRVRAFNEQNMIKQLKKELQ